MEQSQPLPDGEQGLKMLVNYCLIKLGHNYYVKEVEFYGYSVWKRHTEWVDDLKDRSVRDTMIATVVCKMTDVPWRFSLENAKSFQWGWATEDMEVKKDFVRLVRHCYPGKTLQESVRNVIWWIQGGYPKHFAKNPDVSCFRKASERVREGAVDCSSQEAQKFFKGINNEFRKQKRNAKKQKI